MLLLECRDGRCYIWGFKEMEASKKYISKLHAILCCFILFTWTSKLVYCSYCRCGDRIRAPNWFIVYIVGVGTVYGLKTGLLFILQVWGPYTGSKLVYCLYCRCGDRIRVPNWFICLTSLNHVLLTFSSSANFFIYISFKDKQVYTL